MFFSLSLQEILHFKVYVVRVFHARFGIFCKKLILSKISTLPYINAIYNRFQIKFEIAFFRIEHMAVYLNLKYQV